MSRVRLILVALLFCCWSLRIEADDAALTSEPKCGSKQTPANITNSTSGGYVKLTSHGGDSKAVKDGACVILTCEGSAYPHKRVTWYRLVDSSNPSSAAPITEYWSKYYYYQISRGATILKDQISSTLKIPQFGKGYAGKYYCVLTNGKISIKSPTTHFKSSDPTAVQGPGHQDQLRPNQPLHVLNITAVSITNTSILISWDKWKRISDNEKFCKMWNGKKLSRSYQWKLDVLMWGNWTDFNKNDKTIKDSNKMEYIDYNGHKMTRTLTKEMCRNESYLLTNVSLSAYYKFQITVQKYEDSKQVGEFVARNGSYIHYFAEQSDARVVYPTAFSEVCRSNDPCKATGNPQPRVQLVQEYESLGQNNNDVMCIATNMIIDNFGTDYTRSDIVRFYWKTSGCPTPPTPNLSLPSCQAVQRFDTICSEYIPQGTRVYVPGGENVTQLENDAENAIQGLGEDNGTTCYKQMVKFICYSYLSPCYLDTKRPRSVCPQSCNYIQQECNNKLFRDVQNQLPQWSLARNCSNLVQAEAGSPQECIHLSVPAVEEEEHTNGSCVVGKGTSYSGKDVTSGCLEWDDEKQVYYDISVFPELKSAGSSCRNPGGSGKRPWCYTDLTTTTSARWKYCDIPKCPSCERVPDVCREAYKRNVTVHVTDDSYPVGAVSQDCFPKPEDRCYKVWRTVVCHLSYPECVEAQESNKLHGSRPLCKSYCNAIKNATKTCGFPSSCDKSLFIHRLDSIDCERLDDKNCISAELELEVESADPLVDLGDDTKQNTNHQLAISIYVAAAVCLFSVFTIIAIIIGYCCCLYTHESSSEPKLKVKPIENPFDHPVFARMNMRSIENPDYTKCPSEKDSTLAFKSLRPISKSKIHYIRDLGSGNFGLVYQGKVDGITDGEEFTMAAIKTLKEGTSAEGMKNFLHEAKLACQFDHENIIKLYGICMSEGFYCLVFEYMDLGDLNEYLRSSASSTQRRIMNPLDNSIRSRTESSLSNSPARLNPQQLVSICHQIALGMEYFASLNHVHRDLATRNCLVGTGLVVKIGDFGMSQTLYHSDYYKQKGEQALPVRWMAPEAFIYGRFSTEGDVWSFGVVMWEVFSFAMQPYYGKMNDQVMNEVRRGHTLSRPDDCHESIFEIMRSCWQMEPHRRPSFSELVEELNNWKPTHSSTSTAQESQGSTKGDMEDSLSLASIQDKDLELSVFDEYDMSGTEEDIAN